MNIILLYIVTAFTFINTAILAYLMVKIYRFVKNNVVKPGTYRMSTTFEEVVANGDVVNMLL